MGVSRENDKSRSAQIRDGFKDSLSVGFGIFPLGVGLGFLVVQTGLPWWVAIALPTVVFAGSVEFMLVGLLAAGASILTIAVTVFAVNFRHVFYAFSFPLHLTKPGLKRTYSVYALVDEAYATAVMVPEKQNSEIRLLSMQVACQIYWLSGSIIGMLVGRMLPQTIAGFEFALVALFTVMTIDAFRGKRELPSVILAGLSVSISLVLAPQNAILIALILFFVFLTARYILVEKNRGENE